MAAQGKRDINDLLREGKLPSIEAIIGDPNAPDAALADEVMPITDYRPPVDVAPCVLERARNEKERSKARGRNKNAAGIPFVTGVSGKPLVGEGNVLLLIEVHNLPVVHNELTGSVEICGDLPWEPVTTRREWTDTDDTNMAAWVQRTYEFAPGSYVCGRCIEAFARRSSYHPIRDYLKKCMDKWDGIERVKYLFSAYFGADQPPEYLEAVSTEFMVGAVARVQAPGCKVDTIPVVDGPQGVGKSTAFRTLFDPWFTDNIGDIRNKDASTTIKDFWCVEFAELRQFRAADVTEIKDFLTRQVDTYRPAYGRRAIKAPRQCVFVATTNTSDWQKDETGARRFWPVTTLGMIDTRKLAEDKDQLWGEAMYLYSHGAQWYGTVPLDILAAEHEAHREVDAIETAVEQYLVTHADNGVTVGELLKAVLDLDRAAWTRADQMRVGRILTRFGWARKRPTLPNGVREWRYYPPHDWGATHPSKATNAT
jgi:predicted P-loop ATPase